MLFRSSPFFLCVAFPAIVITKAKVTQNGIWVIWWLWLAWFGTEDTVVTSFFTVGAFSEAIAVMHGFWTISANISIIAS